jgi:hypothetical protein
VFPGAFTFYPAGLPDLRQLNPVPKNDPISLAEVCSAASGVTHESLEEHALVIFPCKFDWQRIRSSSHKDHLDLIRQLSGEVDRCCLNFVRYRLCKLGPVPDEGLPAHAGQVADNHMMAGALLYGGSPGQAMIIGGAAFSYYLTRGMGLPLDQIEWDEFPRNGEVGQIVNHALSLYMTLLESPSPTTRFVQTLSLLEFLACPDDYLQFKKVSRIIARYIAQNSVDYQRILSRFHLLTGKESEDGRKVGYRTRVVHIGDRIEKLVPDPQALEKLFLELDDYIRPVMDHMLAHSEMSWHEYLKVRETLRSFEK